MLCAIQLLRSGVTTLQDDFLDDDGSGAGFDSVASAYRDAGLRAVITTSFLDVPFLDGTALPARADSAGPGRRVVGVRQRRLAGPDRNLRTQSGENGTTAGSV